MRDYSHVVNVQVGTQSLSMSSQRRMIFDFSISDEMVLVIRHFHRLILPKHMSVRSTAFARHTQPNNQRTEADRAAALSFRQLTNCPLLQPLQSTAGRNNCKAFSGKSGKSHFFVKSRKCGSKFPKFSSM